LSCAEGFNIYYLEEEKKEKNKKFRIIISLEFEIIIDNSKQNIFTKIQEK